MTDASGRRKSCLFLKTPEGCRDDLADAVSDPDAGGLQRLHDVRLVRPAALSRHPDVISLNGEDSVFQKLHGFFPLASAADSDGLPAGFKPGRAALRAAAEDMLLDSGCGWDGRGAFPAGDYAADCARRFLLQACF